MEVVVPTPAVSATVTGPVDISQTSADSAAGLWQRSSGWILFLVATAAVLYVPYFIPQQPSSSYSWLFGYNNRAAAVLILFFAVAGAVLTRGRFVSLQWGGTTQKVAGWARWVSMGIAACWCSYLYLHNRAAEGFMEASYNIHRTWLVSIGKRPYVDFEWPFGVAQLYIPAWIAHVFSMGIKHAVYLYWGFGALAGIALLHAAISRVDYPSKQKTVVYFLVYGSTLWGLTVMGVQYTLLRYTAPIFLVLMVFDWGRKARDRGDWRRMMGACWGALVCLFLISPEMAVAFTAACAMLLFPRRLEGWPKPTKWQYAMLVGGLVLICAVAMRLHEFDTARSDSGGSEAFPVALSRYTLFMFWEIAICSSAAYKIWTGRKPMDNSIALIALCVPLLPAAFARADGGHMFFNLMGLAIAALLYASTSVRLWRLFASACLLLYCCFPYTGYLMQHIQHRRDARQRAVGQVHAAERAPSDAAPPVPAHIDFATVYPGLDLSGSDGILQAPFGYSPTQTGGYYLSTQIDYGYFKGDENAHSVAAIDHRVEELRAHPQRSLLVAAGATTDCRSMNGSKARAMLSGINGTLYRAPVVHTQDPMWALCSYIETHYRMSAAASPQNWKYELWTPKTAAGVDEAMKQ